MKFLFYCFSNKEIINNILEEKSNYNFALWKPFWCKVFPPGFFHIKFIVWWLFHFLRIFRNPEYGVLVGYDGKQVMHRSVILPPYMRFPFMAKDDLQISDVWTKPDYRGKGIATAALKMIITEMKKHDRKLWYVVEESNISSIHVAEKVGLKKVGRGYRTKSFGFNLLGAYLIDEKNYEK